MELAFFDNDKFILWSDPGMRMFVFSDIQTLDYPIIIIEGHFTFQLVYYFSHHLVLKIHFVVICASYAAKTKSSRQSLVMFMFTVKYGVMMTLLVQNTQIGPQAKDILEILGNFL